MYVTAPDGQGLYLIVPVSSADRPDLIRVSSLTLTLPCLLTPEDQRFNRLSVCRPLLASLGTPSSPIPTSI